MEKTELLLELENLKKGLETSLDEKSGKRIDEKLATVITAIDELKALKDENNQLKKLVAKLALTIEIKEELLKKTSLRTGKNY